MDSTTPALVVAGITGKGYWIAPKRLQDSVAKCRAGAIFLLPETMT